MKVKIENISKPFIMRVSDEGHGVISFEGNVLRLDPVAVDIIKVIDKSDSITQATNLMSEMYDVQAEVATKDIMNMIEKMESFGMVDPEYIDRMRV